jgi:hypothetical protein
VTKFRVYNSRKYQVGGDRPETYFEQTANIAGIEDARVQELMPDALRFLGITKIDRLLSMSKDKYDSLTGAGIEIAQRVSLPESWVPKNAEIEITAKIAAGYNGFQPEVVEAEDGKTYLWSLDAIRARSEKLLDIGLAGGLEHFAVHEDKLDDAATAVINTMSRRFPRLEIPIHSRYRHFEAGGVDRLGHIELGWSTDGVDAMEAVRRKIDLVVVSVLLDAGAGAAYSYTDGVGVEHSRSEGLAVASLDMFKGGAFSGCGGMVADAEGLSAMTEEQLATLFQVRATAFSFFFCFFFFVYLLLLVPYFRGLLLLVSSSFLLGWGSDLAPAGLGCKPDGRAGGSGGHPQQARRRAAGAPYAPSRQWLHTTALPASCRAIPPRGSRLRMGPRADRARDLPARLVVPAGQPARLRAQAGAELQTRTLARPSADSY